MQWVVGQVVQDLQRLGLHGHILLKGDQEYAIQEFLREVSQRRGTQRTTIQKSPVGDSRANGVAERAVQSFEETLRVQKLSLEERMQKKLPMTHKLIPGIVEHCADLLNKFVIGNDGRSAYHRMKGRQYHGHM